MKQGYWRAIKSHLLPDAETPCVMICNFEPERAWSAGVTGLPAPPQRSVPPIVQKMEELGICLAAQEDYVCLGQPADSEWWAYLEALGMQLPTPLVCRAEGDRTATTSEQILASPPMIRQLSQLAKDGAYLLPMGVTPAEERIAELTGLPLALPTASVMARVNSKIYSRRLVAELKLPPVPGDNCMTVDELAAALDHWPADDVKPVVVKDALGVSGKGLVVLDAPERARRLLKMVQRRADRTGHRALHVVVERYLSKRYDLNYQFTIGRDGGHQFDFIKQAVTERGVHRGHIMPADLDPSARTAVYAAADRLAPRLRSDGYFGIVGVDAILGSDGTLYPVLEINARLNMASYQGALIEKFSLPGGAALAKFYPTRPGQVTFTQLRDRLSAELINKPGEAGAVINCFATADGGTGPDKPAEGRLYTMLFASDRAELGELDHRISTALRDVGSNRDRDD